MIQRCTNPNHEQYPDYGGRGIEVCYKWRKSFLAFIRDMGIRPKGKTLDRLNVNGTYTFEKLPVEQCEGTGTEPPRSVN